MDALKDIDGAYSSKRVAAFIALALFSLIVFVDLYLAVTTSRPPSDSIVSALMVIISGGFLTAVAERYASKT